MTMDWSWVGFDFLGLNAILKEYIYIFKLDMSFNHHSRNITRTLYFHLSNVVMP